MISPRRKDSIITKIIYSGIGSIAFDDNILNTHGRAYSQLNQRALALKVVISTPSDPF